ncbi:MAG: hypothetical protein WC380_00290 [Pedobacter sp.]|jgi:hypothetical protein
MAEIFKIPVNGKDMDFHCGTYATEKTLEAMGISLSDIGESLDKKFVPTIRHFIYFSAKDAQRLKTEKGQAIDFPYEPDNVYDWLDEWGGGNSPKVAEFTAKLLVALFGTQEEPEQKKSMNDQASE